MSRQRRTALSFAVVLVAFWVYRWTVAPWIDPSFVRTAPDEAAVGSSSAQENEPLAGYQQFFPEGAWEREDPIVVENGSVKLLMKDYENLFDGRIRLAKCTMLFFPQGDSTPEGQPRRVVILQAPEGAILQFDSELNLRRGKVGRLIGGHLGGPVTIHGTPSKPGADDALLITTRDLHLDQQKAWTNHVVDFRYGPHYGRGREMIIDLLPASGSSGRRRGPNIAGMERLRLVRDVSMHLQPVDGFLPGDESTATAVPLPDAATGRMAYTQPPIDIRCQGPFRFEMIPQMAAFENDVKVYRVLPEGVSDQMQCDRLDVYFARRANNPANGSVGSATSGPPSLANSATSGGVGGLEPIRMEATGYPLTVRAPSNQLFVEAHHLEYDIRRRRIVVGTPPSHGEATVLHKQDEFHGHHLAVERPLENAFPVANANGAGRLRVVNPDDPDNTLEARWTKELKTESADRRQTISLVGGAWTKFNAFGDLEGEEIQLKLLDPKVFVPRGAESARAQTADGGKLPQALPEQLVASGNVVFNSPELTGSTERLEVWFDPAGMLQPTPPKHQTGRSVAAMGTLPPGRGTTNSPLVGQPPAATLFSARAAPSRSGVYQPAIQGLSTPSGRKSNDPAEPPADSKYDLHGSLIRVQLRSKGRLTQLENADVEGQVRFNETHSPAASQSPLALAGNRLEIRHATEPTKTAMVVAGRPAEVAARGLQMMAHGYGSPAGPRDGLIQLDRGKNRLWIDGPGRMVLPPSAMTPRPNALSTRRPDDTSFGLANLPSPAAIDFQGNMDFDGSVVTFQKNIVVHSEARRERPERPQAPLTEQRKLKTETVKVTLRRRVDFTSTRPNDRAEVEEVYCLGAVEMENRTSDERGLIGLETVHTRDLSLQQSTGDIKATGPGRLESRRLGSANPLGSVLGAPAGNRERNATGQPSDRLTYTRVDFEHGMRGNIHHRELKLHRHIRGVYGPVARWGDTLELNRPPVELGDQGLNFKSDELIVSQDPNARANTEAFELQAIGNAEFEGQAFVAQGDRLKYSGTKGQLILEGDGRTPARLYYQQVAGGPQTKTFADRLTYWPKTRQTQIDKAHVISAGDRGFAGADPPRR